LLNTFGVQSSLEGVGNLNSTLGSRKNPKKFKLENGHGQPTFNIKNSLDV
jgi:hypothetical protein